MYVRPPLSLRKVEDLLHEQGIGTSSETIRCWWKRFGSVFNAEILRKPMQQMRSYFYWQWRLDEIFCEDQRSDALPLACR